MPALSLSRSGAVTAVGLLLLGVSAFAQSPTAPAESTNSLGMKLRAIPVGRFFMGQDGPAADYRSVKGIDSGRFALSDTMAEPQGYLAATQTRDGLMQLISSKIHYVFNLAWLKALPAVASTATAKATDEAHLAVTSPVTPLGMGPMTIAPADQRNVTIYGEEGRYGGWPANHGLWQWGDEIVAGFTSTWFKHATNDHSIDRDKPMYEWQARSLDGGKTWKTESDLPFADATKEAKPAPLTEPLDFTAPDFALMFRFGGLHVGPSWFYTSPDRCRTWRGPYSFSVEGVEKVCTRTDLVVLGPRDCLMFGSCAKSNDGKEGRVFCARTTDGGLTWKFVSWVGPEPQPEGFAIMPSTVRLPGGALLTAIRMGKPSNNIVLWRSDDLGQHWTLASTATADIGGNPPAMVLLQDGRLCLTYGYRRKPVGARARISADEGRAWGPEIVLRDDGFNGDLGYPRSITRPNGEVLTVYYFNGPRDEDRTIQGTFWTPPPAAAPTAATTSPLTPVLQKLVDDDLVLGATALVANKERVLAVEAVGHSSALDQTAMRPDSLFWIASMTKSMTSAALMMLVDEGKLAIADPVEKYLPEFKGQMVEGENGTTHPPQHPITIREILSHTSGLVFPNDKRIGRTNSLRDDVPTYGITPLRVEPGTKYEYNNTGIDTAGRIIEVVSGQSYADFMQQRLFTPLGMKDTTFWPTEEQMPRLAHAARRNADTKKLEQIQLDSNVTAETIEKLARGAKVPHGIVAEMGIGKVSEYANHFAMPAGGLFSTAPDVGRFCQMLLHSGTFEGRRYLSSEALQQMTTIQTGDIPMGAQEALWARVVGQERHGRRTECGQLWPSRRAPHGDVDRPYKRTRDGPARGAHGHDRRRAETNVRAVLEGGDRGLWKDQMIWLEELTTACFSPTR